jgi:hypothetical protein
MPSVAKKKAERLARPKSNREVEETLCVASSVELGATCLPNKLFRPLARHVRYAFSA